MKTITLISGILLGAVTFVSAATNDLTTALQRGLFEEEANQNLGAAIQAYQTVANQFDKDRKLAATAIFRLGECYRKQANTNEAAAQYQRILREFSDQPTLVTLSRQNLAGIGSAPAASANAVMLDAARQEQKRLLEEEIKLVQKQLEMQQKQVQMGVVGPDALWPTEREILKLKREVVALDAGLPISITATETAATATPAISDTARQEKKRLLEKEIERVQKQLLDAKRSQQQARGVGPSQPPSEVLSLEPKLLELKRLLAALDAGLPASAVTTDTTADMAAKAEAEALAFGSQLEALNGLPKDKLLIAVQQYYPDQELTSLLQKRAEAEQQVASLQRTYTPKHPAIQAAVGRVEMIDKQIDEQVLAVVKRLQAKWWVLKVVATNLTAQARSAGLRGNEPASSDAEEVKRIQAMIKDSPDLINAKDASSLSLDTPLLKAAKLGQLVVAEFLLTNGADVEAKDRHGKTPLRGAAANGHKAMVELLLKHRASVRAADDNGETALHLAARHGYRSVAEVLLAHGAEVDARNKNAATPLLLACANGFKSMAELLLAHGADINAPSSRNDSMSQGTFSATALGIAAVNADQPLVELLLSKGAQVNAEDKIGRTPLSYAAQEQSEPVVKLLLAAGANPNAGRLNLPLVLAAAYGDMPTLKLLLAHDADPNTNSKIKLGSLPEGDYTPLAQAVFGKHADAVTELIRAKADPNGSSLGLPPLLFRALSDIPTLKVLLEGGANPNVRTAADGNPMLLQAVKDRSQPAVELLLAHKAEVNATNNAANTDGWAPLHVAAQWEYTAIAELLLKGGADVNARDKYGRTPLHTAVSSKQRELAELLLAHQADVNATDAFGWTPLHRAASNGNKPIAELLLKAGADVKARDNGGSTPLHIAVRDRQQELAELLLANKADPNARNNEGQTPLDLAKSQAQTAQARPPGVSASFPERFKALTGPEQAAKAEVMANLLRQYGAADDLPRLDCIELRRPSTKYSGTVFTKGTNDWNQFTLFELIAVHYHFLAASPEGETLPANRNKQLSWTFPFPDFALLRLRRPDRDPKVWHDQTIDIRSALESTNCAADVRLGWGDVVEIPEADHPVDKPWPGIPPVEFRALKECLKRQVQLVIKGQATNLTLAPSRAYIEVGYAPSANTPLAAFWIKPVVWNSGLVLASSDMSRVKVTRRDPATGQTREWVVDCLNGSPAPPLWLRDGDKIEVPEKTN